MSAVLTDQETEELSDTNARLRRENAALRQEVAAHVRRTEDPLWVVLLEVYAECKRQEARYGTTNRTLPDGTGLYVKWMTPFTDLPAHMAETAFRRDYEAVDDAGQLTWMHLVREEIAESFKESEVGRLTSELVQVAALTTTWTAIARDRA